MKFEETKNKLEEYRKKKLEEEIQSSRRQLIWDLVTLQPVRRNLTRNKKADESEEKDENKPPEDQEDDEETKDRTWSRIDYAIFFVKFLVWACIQMIFVKIEFGAVFFIVSCILFMTSNLGKRKSGEASAYSVFNENCEALDGTFSGQQFDQQLRRGGM